MSAYENVELHEDKHTDEYGDPRGINDGDVAQCGECQRQWCYTCHPTPASRCPFEYEHDELEVERPTVQEEAERLLGYWEIHGDSPEAVEKWAVSDILYFVRLVLEQSA